MTGEHDICANAGRPGRPCSAFPPRDREAAQTDGEDAERRRVGNDRCQDQAERQQVNHTPSPRAFAVRAPAPGLSFADEHDSFLTGGREPNRALGVRIHIRRRIIIIEII